MPLSEGTIKRMCLKEDVIKGCIQRGVIRAKMQKSINFDKKRLSWLRDAMRAFKEVQWIESSVKVA